MLFSFELDRDVEVGQGLALGRDGCVKFVDALLVCENSRTNGVQASLVLLADVIVPVVCGCQPMLAGLKRGQVEMKKVRMIREDGMEEECASDNKMRQRSRKQLTQSMKNVEFLQLDVLESRKYAVV